MKMHIGSVNALFRIFRHLATRSLGSKYELGRIGPRQEPIPGRANGDTHILKGFDDRSRMNPTTELQEPGRASGPSCDVVHRPGFMH